MEQKVSPLVEVEGEDACFGKLILGMFDTYVI